MFLACCWHVRAPPPPLTAPFLPIGILQILPFLGESFFPPLLLFGGGGPFLGGLSPKSGIFWGGEGLGGPYRFILGGSFG